MEPIDSYFFLFSIGVGGDLVGFNEEGDSFGKYDIFQYQQISKGVYKYVHIGDWIDRFGYYQHEMENRNVICSVIQPYVFLLLTNQ